MAYSTSNPPRCVSQSVGADGGDIWIYRSTDDLNAVSAADYVSNGAALGMVAGDVVHVIDTTNTITSTATVSSVTAGGAATIAGSSASQELTASGAITPNANSIELNHATVVIAATIADSLDHQGLFVIKDTSASGTAAHTVTLTSGTFNGTATIATLNAPNEALVVWFDSAGNGTIVENVGTVVLS